jgi:DNA-binding response OmpR family regulator
MEHDVYPDLYLTADHRGLNPVAEVRTVVVTDDERGMLSLYNHMLEREGFRTFFTVDSWEVLDICRTHDVDLVVSDIIKPDLNGLELLEHLRSDSRTWHIPVIFVSARGDASEIAFRMGAESFIHKPFHPAELLREIHRLLGSAPV